MAVDINVRVRQSGDTALDKINRKLKSLKINMAGVQEASQALVDAGSKMTALGAGMSIAAAVPVKFAADFQKSMSGVQAITGATGQSFDALEKKALNLGRSTQFTATQSAEAMQFLGRAGFKTTAILDSMQATLTLAAVENMGLAESANIASTILKGMGIEASQLSRVVDVLANVTTGVSVNLVELGEAMKYAAPIAAAASIDINELATVLGLLADAGLKGSTGGTAFRAMMIALLNPSAESAAMLKKLGIQVANSEGKFVGFRSIIEQFTKKLKELGGETEQLGALMQIFQKQGGTAMAKLLDYSTKTFDALHDKTFRAGKGMEIAKIQMDNLHGAITRLTSASEGFLISLGRPFLEVLQAIIDKAAESVTSFTEWTETLGPIPQFVVGLTGTLGGFIAILGGVTVALGASGLAIIAIKAGLTAWSTMLPVVTAKLGIFNAVLTTTTGKIGLLIAVFTAGWQIGEWISDMELFGMSIKNWVDQAILEFRLLFNTIELKYLKLKRITLSLLRQDTTAVDAEIKRQKEFIKELDRSAEALFRLNQSMAKHNKLLKDNQKTATDTATPSKRTATDAFAQAIAEETNFDDYNQSFLKDREKGIAEYVEKTKTKLDELKSAYHKGEVSFETLITARRSMLGKVLKEETALLKARIDLAKDEDEKRRLTVELIRKEEEAKRALNAMSEEEARQDQQTIRNKQEVAAAIRSLNKEILGNSVADIKARNRLTLEEMRESHAREIDELRAKGATEEQLERARLLHSRLIAKERDRQSEQLFERQRQISETLRDIEREGLGQSLEDRRRRHDLELQELDSQLEDEIKRLRDMGATTEQIEQARQNKILAIKQKAAEQAKALEEETKKQIEEQAARLDEQLRRVEKVSEVFSGLRHRVGETSDEDYEMEQLRTRQEQEKQLLEEFLAQKKSIEEAALSEENRMKLEKLKEHLGERFNLEELARLHRLEREKKENETFENGLKGKLAAAGVMFGTLKGIANDFYEASGRQSKAAFEFSKAAAIGEAVIHKSLAIMKAYSELGPIAGSVMAAFLGVQLGMEIAKINAQKMAEGGLLVGGSGYKDDLLVAAMGGEYFIPKGPTSYYGVEFFEALRRKSIPRDAALSLIGNVKMPAHTPPTPMYAGGGMTVPELSLARREDDDSPREINNINVVGMEALQQLLAQKAGQDMILNVLGERAEDLRGIF